ncbi:MAG TPA: DNA internalization-related competence protein ComEC/Rec2 [Longimicrobiales bacterium]
MTLLLWVTLGYAAGLLAGLRQPLPLAVVAALCAAAPAALWLRPRAAAVAAFAGIGAVVGVTRADAAARDCREHLRDGVAVALIGVPLVVPTPGVTLPLHAGSVTAGSVHCADVVIGVRAAARHHAVLDSAVRIRAAVAVRGRWMAYSRRNGWPRRPEHAGALLVDRVTIATAAGAPDAVTRMRTAQQRRLRAMLPRTWGLAESLLLAERAGLTPDVRMRWVSAGLVHLLAISGLHVGLIAAGALLLCSLAGLPPRTGRRVAILVSATYVLFLGAPSAALRSLLQAALLLASSELQRPAEPFTALAAAGIGILLLEPLAILDAGFQLSFAGMIGLIAWRRPIADALPATLNRYVREGLATGIAATALTTPVAALHFGTVAWIGIPATLVAAPLLAVALALLATAMLSAALLGASAGPHAWAAETVLRLLDRIAETAAAVPGGHGYVAWTTVLVALAACAAALLVRAVQRAIPEHPPPAHASAAAHRKHATRARRRRIRAGVAAAAALALVAWAPLVLRPHDDRVEIHAIDVGQGDAIAVRTPAGRWLLVDAGPRTPRSDAGRDRVVPYLLRHDARRIEALILTHPDADHIGGAAAVLDALGTGLVVDPGLPAGKDIFIDLLAAARHSGQRWAAARAGMTFDIDGVRITLLYPRHQVDGTRDANDNSVVFRLEFGAFAALFLGDAPLSVEEDLVARHGGGLGAAVLKVGHHGSATSTGEALLRAARPSVALLSVGRNNRYGHPSRGVLRRLENHQVRVLRTDRLGSFVVRATRTGRIDILARERATAASPR